MPANFSRELIVIKVDPDVDSIRENVVSGVTEVLILYVFVTT